MTLTAAVKDVFSSHAILQTVETMKESPLITGACAVAGIWAGYAGYVFPAIALSVAAPTAFFLTGFAMVGLQPQGVPQAIRDYFKATSFAVPVLTGAIVGSTVDYLGKNFF